MARKILFVIHGIGQRAPDDAADRADVVPQAVRQAQCIAGEVLDRLPPR